jgi:hypothetical protein
VSSGASLNALVAGYHRIGDGGGGIFVWSPTATQPVDGVLIFGSQRASGGRWLRQTPNARLAPEMAGAVGDGVHDDAPAFERLIGLSRASGAFTIELQPGRRYYVAETLDMSAGAPGLTISGPASALAHSETWLPGAFTTRIELAAEAGATIKLGTGQVLRNVLIWRHGLPPQPATFAAAREQVDQWFAEDGRKAPRSVAVTMPFHDATVESSMIVGFHTGISATGSRFRIRHSYIDAAGYAIDVSGSKDTSLIEDVQARAFWATNVDGSDALGDHSYRPGTAFYVHGGADGLQINSAMAIGWVNGLWLAGEPGGDDWLISTLQIDVETPPNGGAPTAGIKTTGAVRRLTVIDPRIVAGGTRGAGAVALDFGQNDTNPAAAANNNVTVIGGTLEVAGAGGSAVVLRAGSTGTLIGTTLNLADTNNGRPLIRAERGVGNWTILAPRVSGFSGREWLQAEPSASAKISIETVAADPLSAPPNAGRERGPPRNRHDPAKP